MKINDRTLIAFSTSLSSPTDKEGWLFKRGEGNKSFQKRYFVLKGNLLFYFEKPSDKEPLGVVILEGCTVELAEEEQEKLAFKIAFHGEGKRTYIIGTESQETLEEWMKVLACASYDYMKLMVMELQQQLDDLEEAEQRKEKVASESQGQSDVLPQVVPPPRSNPFNDKRAKRKTWTVLHSEIGERILEDRQKWSKYKV